MESNEIKTSVVSVKLPDCIDKTVENLAAPVAKSVGTTLSDLWYVVFGKISVIAEEKRILHAKALEQFKNNLDQRIEAIPEDKRIMPDTQVVCGALEDSRFCVDKDELRTMFENLIVSSLNSDTTNDVHPSFSGFIRHMTCADARMLARFKESERLPVVNYHYNTKNGGILDAYRNVITPSQDGLELKSESSSLNCLQALGLISVVYDKWFLDESAYTALVTAPFFEKLKSTVSSPPEDFREASGMGYEKGIAFLTDLGKQFVAICFS